MNLNHKQMMQQARLDAKQKQPQRKEADMSHITNDSDLMQCMTVRKAHISHLRLGVDNRDCIR